MTSEDSHSVAAFNKNLNGNAILIVNPKDAEFSVEVPAGGEQYMLTTDELLTKRVYLN